MRPLIDSLNRREFVALGLYGGAALLIPSVFPSCGSEGQQGNGTSSQEEGRFFDRHQYETVRALAGIMIPEDDDAGAISASVVDYIDFLLGAFRVTPPRIYAAGPFSGRHGGENGFAKYLPLSRVKEISWRILIEGSKKTIPEWEELTGRPHTDGLQEIYTRNIESLDEICRAAYQADFTDIGTREQAGVVKRKMDAQFRQVVLEHTVEGMYAAPEYGGNAGCAGWSAISYEGDRQPVGYSREQVGERDKKTRGGDLSEQDTEDIAQILQGMIASSGERFSKGFTGGRT